MDSEYFMLWTLIPQSYTIFVIDLYPCQLILMTTICPVLFFSLKAFPMGEGRFEFFLMYLHYIGILYSIKCILLFMLCTY